LCLGQLITPLALLAVLACKRC